MRALVAASQHWLDAESVRQHLVGLPISSTVVVSNRRGGDKIVAKIAEEEMALRVEIVEVDDNSFRQEFIQIISSQDIDSAYFFCLSTSETEHALSRLSRASRIPTSVIVKDFTR